MGRAPLPQSLGRIADADARGVPHPIAATVRDAPAKLVADCKSYRILGCHVVGERAVEIVQLAAIAIAAEMQIDELARVAVSFPTYAEVLVHAAVRAAAELRLPLGGQVAHVGVRVIPA